MNPTWSEPAIDLIVRLVGTRTGLVLRPAQRDLVEPAIRRAMQTAGQATPLAYYHQLQQQAKVFDDLVAGLTVGETYFFRDPGQFDVLRREIVPQLIRQREASHHFRVWSAGCATGEEPYSLAMLFQQVGLAERVRIVGTDVSRRALARAREANFGAWSLRGDGAVWAKPHLLTRGDRFEVEPAIRERVRFEYLNLALDSYPSVISGTHDVDLILCRNVLIYFDRDTIASVARRLHAALADGGWLITAAGDPPLADFAPFDLVVTPAGTFYRCDRKREALRTPARHEPLAVDDSPGARQAFDRGDYDRAAELAADSPSDPIAWAIRIQALANVDLREAERECARAVLDEHPVDPQLHYLHAVLLLELDETPAAAVAARRALFLDDKLAIAHFTLGSILRRLDDLDGARRAFRNARDLCLARPADEPVRFAPDEHAGNLARAAELQLRSLE